MHWTVLPIWETDRGAIMGKHDVGVQPVLVTLPEWAIPSEHSWINLQSGHQARLPALFPSRDLRPAPCSFILTAASGPPSVTSASKCCGSPRRG